MHNGLSMTRALLLVALLLPACFASAEKEQSCYIPESGVQAAKCDEGGCQATFVACGDADPTPRLSVGFAAIEPACVHFPEFAEWRCYWSAE